MEKAKIIFTSKKRILDKEHSVYIGNYYKKEIEEELYEVCYDTLVKAMLNGEKDRNYVLGYIDALNERKKIINSAIDARQKK